MAHARRQVDAEWVAAGAGVALAILGWVVDGTLLAVAGMLLALAMALLWVWGRECLTGVGYVRTLGQDRATFGERVTMDVELVNDKLLPLTWLRVSEEVPTSLGIEGGTVAQLGWRSELQLVISMLPYQRVRRQMIVHCDERGEHRFGPATVRSSSPLGTRGRSLEVRNETSLLVYPKVMPLASTLVASRVPIGDRRARHSLALDPSRVVGVRPYAPGDPVRHIDWRATARSSTGRSPTTRGTDLLVRVHEPATALSVALFLDLSPPPSPSFRFSRDIVELTVSVAASLVSHFAVQGVPTGIFASGTARGQPIAAHPSSGHHALTSMLELLARAMPSRTMPIERMLVHEGSRLRAGVSALVVAPSYPESTLVAISELRRRMAVGAVWISTDEGFAPPPGLVDARWEVSYGDDWRTRAVLELTT